MDTSTWPGTIAFVAVLFLGTVLILGASASLLELRKLKVTGKQEDDLRQLIRRYEHLAENSLDAQQRVAADLSELRSRTTAVEQILRTVE